ncbi:polymorphic toxin type 35 domain-containing protein [Brevibacillus ruminantium]|uniref:Polymorphic toxin type 35 domain-containing protein n=1 Tax=Brevibacillus ruminantium TaxID=2950604 RepID=A0ABY4WBS9_9BACL|nr:polymorphic toxin type 35 domain-containing protein [Brevibacillus ruminantium]USG64641.1 polymorphic toxin type 35 domain-containing protein [Brevibacillus ruminantium]
MFEYVDGVRELEGFEDPFTYLGGLGGLVKGLFKAGTKEAAKETGKLLFKTDLQYFSSKIIPEVASLNKNNINKILNPKHAWNKIVENPKDWDSISVIISKVMKEGVEQTYMKVSGGKNTAFYKSLQIGDNIVEVTYQKIDGVIRISNSWVRTR